MNKLIVKILVIAVAVSLPLASHAITIGDVGGSLTLGSADIEQSIVNLIQFVLGFLGLIAVIVILVGGFRWMTAGGNEEKIESAKKLITGAVIGLVIILLAWAIVLFSVNVLTNATT